MTWFLKLFRLSIKIMYSLVFIWDIPELSLTKKSTYQHGFFIVTVQWLNRLYSGFIGNGSWNFFYWLGFDLASKAEIFCKSPLLNCKKKLGEVILWYDNSHFTDYQKTHSAICYAHFLFLHDRNSFSCFNYSSTLIEKREV